jgi:hypothetical protein
VLSWLLTQLEFNLLWPFLCESDRPSLLNALRGVRSRPRQWRFVVLQPAIIGVMRAGDTQPIPAVR